MRRRLGWLLCALAAALWLVLLTARTLHTNVTEGEPVRPTELTVQLDSLIQQRQRIHAQLDALYPVPSFTTTNGED